jgi:hypothetical protein
VGLAPVRAKVVLVIILYFQQLPQLVVVAVAARVLQMDLRVVPAAVVPATVPDRAV